MKCFVALVWMLCATFALRVPAQELPVDLVRVGVEITAIDHLQRGFVDDTLQKLSDAIGKDHKLVVQYFNSAELSDAILRNRVQMFVASAVTYRRSLINGGRDLVVLNSRLTVDPNRTEGGLVLKRLGDNTLQSWNDLKNKRVLYVETLSPTVEISFKAQKLKYDEETTAQDSQIDKVSDSAILALEKLKNETVDAVALPICHLENMVQKSPEIAENLAVLTPRQDQSVACLHSTDLYPGLTVVAMPILPSDVYLQVLRVLLSIQDDRYPYSWSIATDFNALDVVLHELNVDAWAQYRELTWKKFFDQYRLWLLGAVFALIAILLNSVLLGHLVRRRTSELSQALTKQKALRLAADRSRTQLEKMRRLQTIGQLTGLFAHELRQPLNAISCYAYGIDKAVSGADQETKDKVAGGVQALEAQVQRASAVVERVRDYVRSQSSREKIYSLAKLAASSIADFKVTSAGNIPIDLTVSNDKNCDICADEMEIELIVVNLLRNAVQAQDGNQNAWIAVGVVGSEDNVVLSIVDNGPPLSLEELNNIVSIGESTKPEGLGLGLSIVRDLVEAHHGFIRYSLSSSRSLKVEVVFPRANKKL